MKSKQIKVGERFIKKLFEPSFAGKVQKQYELLLKDHPNDPPPLQRHSYGKILPLIAAVQVKIEEGKSTEEAIQEVQDIFYKRFVYSGRDTMKKMLKIPLAYKLFLPITIQVVEKIYGYDAGFSYQVLEFSSKHVEYDILECPYHNLCSQYGLPEMTDIFCTSDDIVNEDAHKNLVFERSKTLGRGDEKCDFHFYRKDLVQK
ncbi:MAG: L-2-amino-thiazoline-4-carboxylic acid hydrolase [Tissierellia bacterium]|nr:L-2-amino-thiazoline-4-carboxylic acid hydrolase [Tissierellia bacterium]